MVDLSPTLTMREGKSSSRRRFHGEEARSLPNSPFVQRRVGPPGRQVLELPPLSIPKQKGDRVQEESVENTSFIPRIDQHNESDSLSSFVSPSLRRKVLRKRNGIKVQHHACRDGDTSDESWASLSPRLLSPGSTMQESNVTLETLFSNVESKSPVLVSPATQRRVRSENTLSKIDHGSAVSLSRTSSPRNSPCQSPGLSRRVVDSYNAMPSHGPAIGELTVENVKALETIADEESHCDNTATRSSQLHHDNNNRQSHHDTTSNHSRHHQQTLITAKLSIENLIGSPVLGSKNGSLDPTGKRMDLIDLEDGDSAIQPPLIQEAESDTVENATMKRCQEWLAKIQLAPNSGGT